MGISLPPEEVRFITGTPEDFYVHLVVTQLPILNTIEVALNTLMTAKQDLYTMPEMPKETHLVCAKWDDNKFYRAKVIECLPDGDFILTLIDYGHTDLFESHSMFMLPSELIGVPPQAAHCRLAGWNSGDTSRHSIEAFQQLLKESVGVIATLQEGKKASSSGPDWEATLLFQMEMTSAVVKRASLTKMLEDERQRRYECETVISALQREGSCNVTSASQDVKLECESIAPVLQNVSKQICEEESQSARESNAEHPTDESVEQNTAEVTLTTSREPSPIPEILNSSDIQHWLATGHHKVDEELSFEHKEEPTIRETESRRSPQFLFGSSREIPMASSIAHLTPENAILDFLFSAAYFSPRKFFVYILPQSKMFPQLEADLTAACQHAARVRPRQLRVGAALAICDGDTYCRAELLEKKSDDEFEVFLLDHGETKLVQFDAIKALPSEFLDPPRCALECRLAGITHKPEDEDEIREFILTTVDDTRSALSALVVSVNNGVAEIEVFFRGEGVALYESQTLSSFLIDLGWAKEKAPPQLAGLGPASDGFRAAGRQPPRPGTEIRPCPRYQRHGHCAYGENCQFLHKLPKPVVFAENEQLQALLPKAGAAVLVQVSCVTSPHSFHAILPWGLTSLTDFDREVAKRDKRHGNLEELMWAMADHYVKQSRGSLSGDPTEGRLVAAKCRQDSRWYRSCILAREADSALKVIHVDFGDADVVDVAEVRDLEERFLQPRFQAVSCRLHGVAPPVGLVEWPDEARHGFFAATEGRTLVANVIEVREQGAVVELYRVDDERSVADILIEKRLACNTI